MTRTRIAVILLPALAIGCASNRNAAVSDDTSTPDYKTIAEDPHRNTTLAAEENTRAVEMIGEGKFTDAESALKRALTADILFGPAHNNLGKVYYQQGKFYLAAWEFQYASKLMPNRPEPLNNLGLVFEAVGKLDEAVEHYGKALATEPDNPEFIGNTARARLRRGDRDEQTRNLLSDLVLKDTRPDWVAWARQQLATLRPAAQH